MNVLIVYATDSSLIFDEHGFDDSTLEGVDKERIDSADVVIGVLPGGPIRVIKGDASATYAARNHRTGEWRYADNVELYDRDGKVK